MAMRTEPNLVKILKTNRLAITIKVCKMITDPALQIEFFTHCSFYCLLILRCHFPSDLKFTCSILTTYLHISVSILSHH